MTKYHPEKEFGGADALIAGETYTINFTGDSYEIRNISQNTVCFRPFKVTNGGGLNLGFDVDEMPLDMVPAYLQSVWGINVNEAALSAMGLGSLDRTADSIEQNSRTRITKNDKQVTVEINQSHKKVPEIIDDGSLRSRTIRYGLSE